MILLENTLLEFQILPFANRKQLLLVHDQIMDVHHLYHASVCQGYVFLY